jgi:hypothetical protein
VINPPDKRKPGGDDAGVPSASSRCGAGQEPRSQRNRFLVLK